MQKVKRLDRIAENLSTAKEALELRPPIRRPRHESVGIDWSRERTVLLRFGLLELWWVVPGRCWAGVGRSPAYLPSELKLVDYTKAAGCEWNERNNQIEGLPKREKTLSEGGKIGAAVIRRYEREISAWFGGLPGMLIRSLNSRKSIVVVKKER